MNIADLLPAALKPYAKVITAVLGSVAAYFTYKYGNTDWAAPVVQVLTVLGVYHADNAATTDDGIVADEPAGA